MVASLILPAIVAGCAVWIASATIWMLLGWHGKDIRPLPSEADFVAGLGDHQLEAGFYMWPNCANRAEQGSDAFKARWASGPWGTINILGARPNFPRNLLGSLAINCVVAFGIAVVIGLARSGGAVTCQGCQIFVPALIAGGVAYCLGGLGNDLFLGKQPRFMLTCALDGLIYALVQAAVLWLAWPAAV
jgi:hypothetical protein